MPIVPGTSGLTKIPKLLEGAKLAFVLALRQAFQSSVTDENLKYSDLPEERKIQIFTAHPLKLEFYPALVVSCAGGDASMKYLMEDFIEEDVENALVKYSGQLNFTISITVLTQSTLERERIIDHLIIFVRHLFRESLHGFGLEYTRDMRIGAESIIEVENKPVYEQTFDIPCYLEYKTHIDQSSLDCIRRINISEIMVGNITVE